MEKYKKIYKGDVEITKIFVGNEKVWPSGTPITGLTITGETEVAPGNTLQLGIEYTPSNTTQQEVTWSSSNQNVATVNSSGLVTAISQGTAIITATSTINGAISDTHNVTISNLYAVIKPAITGGGGYGVTHGLHEHNGWKYSLSTYIPPRNVFYWNDGSVAGELLDMVTADITPILGTTYSKRAFDTMITDTLPADKWYPDLFYKYVIRRANNTHSGEQTKGAAGYKLTNMPAGTYTVKIWDVNSIVRHNARYNINGKTVTPFQGDRFTDSSPDVHGTSSTKPQLKEVTVTIGAGEDIKILVYNTGVIYSGNPTPAQAISAIEIEKLP